MNKIVNSLVRRKTGEIMNLMNYSSVILVFIFGLLLTNFQANASSPEKDVTLTAWPDVITTVTTLSNGTHSFFCDGLTDICHFVIFENECDGPGNKKCYIKKIISFSIKNGGFYVQAGLSKNFKYCASSHQEIEMPTCLDFAKPQKTIVVQ